MTNDELIYELQNANYTVDVCHTELYVRDYYSGGERLGTTVKEFDFTEYEYLPFDEPVSDLSVFTKDKIDNGSTDKPHWFYVWQEDYEGNSHDFTLPTNYTEVGNLIVVCYVQMFDNNSNLVSDYFAYKVIGDPDTHKEE